MLFFSFIPQLIHFGKCHFVESLALLFGFLLYVVEASYEFSICLFKCVVGAHTIEASGIHKREKQVAKLFLAVNLMSAFEFGFHFADFFAHFLPHVFWLIPVEP